jgi:hypothetical protein
MLLSRRVCWPNRIPKGLGINPTATASRMVAASIEDFADAAPADKPQWLHLPRIGSLSQPGPTDPPRPATPVNVISNGLSALSMFDCPGKTS